MSQQATIYIVDDDDSYRRALARLLSLEGFEVKPYATAEELLEEITLDARGCMLADLQLPGLSGLEMQDTLHNAGVNLPLVFLSGHGDIPSTVSAMRSGAVDFLEKQAPKEQLLAAIHRALEADTKCFGKRERLRELRQRFGCLSDREVEVLSHVVRGRMNKEIASDLGIHERTVKLHRTAITTKTKVHSVAELTAMTSELGMFADLP
jgi:FixJ family two-component response regulator